MYFLCHETPYVWGPDIWLALANPLYCFLYNLWTFKGDINAKDEYKFQMALGKEIWFVPVIPHIWILCLQIIIYFHIYPHLQSYLNESDKIEISIGISYLTNHHPHPIKREKKLKGIYDWVFSRALLPLYRRTIFIFAGAPLWVWRVG